jgi:CheY-like chemotaxis protein
VLFRSFAVKDTGIGIPKDRMDRLFHSFSQVDVSTTRKYGGTGLGLAISRKLVDLMNGKIWVESEPGKGSTFHFTIAAKSAPSAKPVYLVSEQPHLEGKRVLIVDDTPTNRLILASQTKSWGMIPVEAASGPEALQHIAKGEPFEIAILDMHMPEMDGLMLAEEIRRHRDEKKLPLVMLSSLGQRIRDPRAEHFSVFLTKPIKPSQLYNGLIQVFAKGMVAIQAAQVGKAEDRESVFDAEMGSRMPLRILLAEDNKTNQEISILILERLGYRADVAGNGVEVLQALGRQSYDVILMDVQMPEMDGLEATRRIRKDFSRRDQPCIIAMTANAMKEDCEQCMAAGMDFFIGKPVKVEELVRNLNEFPAWLGRRNEGLSTATKSGAVAAAREGAAKSASADDILDPGAFQRLKGILGNKAEAMLPGLTSNFCKDSAKLIETANAALSKEQAPELRRAAHTLKSNAANFGARCMEKAARELENLAAAGDLARARGVLARVESEFARAKTALLSGLREKR